MLLKSKLKNFESVLKNNNVLAELEERYCYSKDALNIKTNSLVPDLVVFVETIEDVQKVLSYAYIHEIPVVSRGAGTNMVGSCVCNAGGIVLNFSKMNRILDINPTNMTATVQPGVILGDLKHSVENLGLFYPPDPSNFKVSTVGGSIAQSSGGATSFKYGTTKDYVLSLKVVTSDGRLMTLGTNIPKEASGYHLAQLMVGSEGTLAVIVEATLKLIPKPEAKNLVLAYFNKFSDAVDAVGMIVKLGELPAAIDFMDNNSLRTVEDFLGCGLKTNYECLLLINVEGFNFSIKNQAENVVKALQEVPVAEVITASDSDEIEKLWSARRASYAATARLAPDVISDDIIVPRENLAQMVEKCKEVVDKYNLRMCLVGHVGDGNLHPQIALNLDNDEEFKNYLSAKSEIYNYVISLGGSISAEHGIGLEKLAYFSDTTDSNALEYMKLIKKVFDPKNILNPGKIFII